MKNVLILMMVCLILSPVVMAGESGEGEERGELAVNFDLTVNSDHMAQFEAAMKKQVAWYAAQNETWSWNTWQWVTGPEFGNYVFRSPGHHWVDMDDRSDRSAKATAHFREVVSPHVASVSSDIEMWLDDVSSWAEDYGDIPFVSVITFDLKYGKSKEFHNVLKRIHRVVTEAGWPESFGWITPVSGTHMPAYTLVLPHKNWADMDEPDTPFWKMMEETAGRAEADSIREGLISCVKRQSSALAKFRPDLSYMPEK